MEALDPISEWMDPDHSVPVIPNKIWEEAEDLLGAWVALLVVVIGTRIDLVGQEDVEDPLDQDLMALVEVVDFLVDLDQ